MSHYTVGVVVPKFIDEEFIESYIEEALAPFSENLEVEPYVHITKAELEERYKEYLEHNKDEYKYSFEGYTHDYCGYETDEEGNVISCYNPNSKWELYVIGGRWDGLIETKEAKELNYARIKDILFKKEFSETEVENFKKQYNKLISEGDFYKPEYYQKRYPTLESYIDSRNFSTYAILDEEGKWHEAGQMGWFGTSCSTPEEQKNFKDNYMNIINAQDKDSWLVVVDCHI